MKKSFVLFFAILATMTLSAQVFTEYFENATTGANVEGYNDWYLSLKASEANGVSPIVFEETLFYDGYAGSDKGKSALLDSLIGQESSTQRISTRVVKFGNDTLKPVLGEKMYAAFIVSILPNSFDSYRDFFTWEASSTSSFTRGRIFAKSFPGTSDLQLAVTKNSSSEFAESEVISGGIEIYHLLVLSYEVIDGEKNDIITLYINPDPSKPEAEQTTKLIATDIQSDYTVGSSIIKINLRQRGIGAKIGGIRVGTNWEQVMTNAGSTVSVTGVSLNKETLSLSSGNSETLVATVTPEEATDPSVSWSSSNPSVATVVDGLVNAVASGEATITVTTTDGSFTANCVVTVPLSTVSVTGVSLNKETLSLSSGNSETLTATVSPEGATDPSVSWSSSNPSVATVVDGLVNAVASGEATITVTTTDGSFTANCLITVSPGVGVESVKPQIAQVYPNPVSDVIMIKLADRNASSIEIFNVLGALVYRENAKNRDMFEIPVAGMISKGVYLVKINHPLGNQIERIILK